MTYAAYADMNYSQRGQVAALIENWLSYYTDEVIAQVMPRIDEILNNEFAVNLLQELKDREEQEKHDRTNSFVYYIAHPEEPYGIHRHPLTHSKSYRDVLYDMFIRDTEV